MPTTSKPRAHKKASPVRPTTRQKIKRTVGALKQKQADYLERRPHRALRLTRRRDYIRPLVLPSYVGFTHYVNMTLWRSRKLFIGLIILYAVFYAILVGISSQEAYSSLASTIDETSGGNFSGFWGTLERSGLLLYSFASNGVTSSLGESQQIFAVIMVLLAWLTTVWLLRTVLAGHVTKLRDGIYNAGGPIMALVVITFVLLLQSLPAAVAAIGFVAAQSSGILEIPLISALFWLAAGLLGILSLYLVTSSLFAMVVATLPGMYPGQALKIAADLTLGRRTVLLLRLLWLAVITGLTWVIVLVPVSLLDGALKTIWPAISWLPLVPLTLLLISSFSIIWASAYIYLLYRKVVDYDPDNA